MLGSRSPQTHSGLLGWVSYDRQLERWVVHHRVDWLNPVFEGLSYIGTLGLVWITLALVLALLWRRPHVLLYVLAADMTADLSAFGLREVIGRPRPFLRYPSPQPLVQVPRDQSFPSGHSAVAFACAAVLTYFKPRLAPFVFLLAAAIAWSRVYVGVHYPLDVLGGAALGLVVGGAVIALHRLSEARRR